MNGKSFKCIVTGGVGFIGSHLTDKLIELGHEVEVIDNLSTGKIENLNPKAKFTKADIRDKNVVYNADYIFHLAAIPGVPYSIKNPEETHDVNVNGTFNVLMKAKEAKVKKVIFASTCALYDDEAQLPFTEWDEIHPKTPYGLHKAIGEQYMRLFNEVYGLPTVCLRLFNVYGSRSDPNSEYSLVISKFKKLKKEGKPLTIYGDGEQTRDFVYVDDVVSAFIKAMEELIENEIINICTGKRTSINTLVNLIGGKRVYLPERKGDAYCIEGENSKAKQCLKWIPKINIEKGLKLF